MKKTALLLSFLGTINVCLSQTAPPVNPPTQPNTPSNSLILLDTHQFDDKDYIFTAYVKLKLCSDAFGTSANGEEIAQKDFTFNVVHVTPNNDIVIKLDNFKDAKAKDKNTNIDYAAKFNNQFFLLTYSDFKNFTKEDKSGPNYSLEFGTFSTPFKFRPTKSVFTSNLSLGTSLNYLHKTWWKDWSWGLVLGISLTSVNLDGPSTNDFVKNSTERPALTPSFSFLIAYKNINMTLGSGVDYINNTSDIERSWVFNGKPWIGFGIGINLFSSSSSSTSQKSNLQN